VACETCGAPNADFFTTRGQAVCRICFYRDQTALQDARAEASLAEEMPEGLAPAKKKLKPKPGRVFKTGLVLIAFGLVVNLLMIVVLDDFNLGLLAILVFGIGTTIQGYRTRHFQ